MDAIQDFAKTLFVSNPLLAVAIAFAPTGLPAIIVLYQWYKGEKNKAKEGKLSRDQQRQVELDRQQSLLNDQQSKWFDTLRQENQNFRIELIEVRKDREEVRKDRDDGWDYARAWHNESHNLLRNFRELRHDYMQALQWIQSANRKFPELKLPESISTIPDRPALPMRVEEIGKEEKHG